MSRGPGSVDPTTQDPAGDGWTLNEPAYQLGNIKVDIYQGPGSDNLYAFTSVTVGGVTTTSFFEEVEVVLVPDLGNAQTGVDDTQYLYGG